MATETLQSEDARVVRWRIERLREAGFDEGIASALANHGGVDLHELFTLVDRGCPPHFAARILAPLDLDPSVP
jgi:hypothetical protein